MIMSGDVRWLSRLSEPFQNTKKPAKQKSAFSTRSRTVIHSTLSMLLSISTICIDCSPLYIYSQCIHLLDWFEYCNHVCMVFELLDQSVFDFLKANHFEPFPISHIQHFAKQLLTSVACKYQDVIGNGWMVNVNSSNTHTPFLPSHPRAQSHSYRSET